MGIRFRGSIIGNDPTPTTSGASGIYDLDAYTTYTSVSSWPAGVAGFYRTPLRAIFAYGTSNGTNSTTSINLVSTTGVIEATTTGAGTGRRIPSAAGYGYDKAVFVGGVNASPAPYGITAVNLASNTGVMGSDETVVFPYPIYRPGAATFGTKKAIFTFGNYYGTSGGLITRHNTYVIFSDTGTQEGTYTTASGTYHGAGRSAGYGMNEAIVLTGESSSTAVGTYSSSTERRRISGIGVVGSTTYVTFNSLYVQSGAATRYGTDTSIVMYFNNTATGTYNYINNTGGIGAEINITRADITDAATTYADGNAIMFSSDPDRNRMGQVLISNTGVIGADTACPAGVTTKSAMGAAGYSLS